MAAAMAEEGDQEHAETLPEHSEPQGAASLRKGDVETEGPKAGKGGHETHGAGEHDHPNG